MYSEEQILVCSCTNDISRQDVAWGEQRRVPQKESTSGL